MELNNDFVKLIRAPSLKRGKNDERLSDRIKLKKVLGLTVCSNAALDVSPVSGVLVYPAGCTIVLFNSKKLSQTFLLNTSRKAITAVAYSRCGRYLATGECGLNPTIKVWELDQSNVNYENNAAGNVIAEFPGHKYAISCIAFSPNGRYLVSVGSQHDMIVNVFDWKINLKIASNKVSAKVIAVSFNEDGNYFVTVGNRHVKFWYLEGSRKYKEPIPLMGRSAILGELRNNDFCAVACGKGTMNESTYALTRNGHLVEFNARRLLDKWVACRTTSANCICTSTMYILVGCADAIIRCFNAETLEYITTLPRTHYLGVDVAQGVHIKHMMSAPPNAKYPDTIAIVYDEQRNKVSCVYNDHSLYIWDLRDINRIGKSNSFLYHSACIWGVETVPYNYVKNNFKETLPSNAFFTCSSDNTIRVWDLDTIISNNNADNSQYSNNNYRKNIYSSELLKCMYIDDELNFIKDMDNPILNTEKTSSSYDGRNGVRCIKINSDVNHIATGDRSGNIRIYNLIDSKLITTIEAHDSEVLCLEYTNEKIERKLLASASRDRLIHVFDVLQGYQILQTLDDHSSSITSVRFIGVSSNFHMISCGADKSIIFRYFQNNQFHRGNNCSGKNTLYDMEIDNNCKHVLTACQDRNIRVYSTQNAKHTKTFKGSHSEEGSLIKLSLDLSGIYVATSCTDKTLSVYDYYSSECMARMYGHSELVTGLKFTNDCKHLISASGDGCIFIWQVPHDMSVTMQARLSQQALRSGINPEVQKQVSHQSHLNEFIVDQQVQQQEINELIANETFGSPTTNYMDVIPVTSGYKFSDVGQLPQWAKRKTNEEQPSQPVETPVMNSSPNKNQIYVPLNTKPRGRWAQRSQFEPDDLRNVIDNSQIESSFSSTTQTNINIAYNNLNNNIRTNNSHTHNNIEFTRKTDVLNNAYLSEDSSIDSGVENRRDLPSLSKKLSEHKPLNSLNSESNTEHDGDIEDISDGERTSSDHGMLFYPATLTPNTPTDFKVNAMDVEELRKSVRRQKIAKQGLSIVPMQSAPSTGTGTGTSDDDDEGSTPSGDNAERSLVSTLGGSSENIPMQTSSTFLQIALDGPGSLSDRERGRKSLSAKHNNTDNKNIPSALSKSFTNSKKEELMKVIKDAKAKLENGRLVKNDVRIVQSCEVGYRSNLRTSHSISDLSYATNIESRISRVQHRPGDINTNKDVKSSNINNYNYGLNKSVINQNNSTLLRKKHYDLPPYSTDNRIYNNNNRHSVLHKNANELIELPPYLNSSNHYQRPNTLELNSTTPRTTGNSSLYKKTDSIPLKYYKSCPVSPVHEELEWTTDTSHQRSVIHNRNEPKRHSMYSDDAKTILDMIHTDTEKMIAEITKKYGDLDETLTKKPIDNTTIAPKPIPSKRTISGDNLVRTTALKEKNEHGFLSEEDANFSSDSLEDCSLDIDLNNKVQRVCKKHKKKNEKGQTLPKRSVSDYFLYDDFININPNRNVSLNDILDDSNENKFLETQRHSSASFFLRETNMNLRKSAESVLSTDLSINDGITYCDSMESILSDDSECKSAPLEMLFERNKKDKNRYSGNIMINNKTTKVENSSKSYGSSPNNCTNFDYFMENDFYYANNYDISNYGYDNLCDYRGKQYQAPTTSITTNKYMTSSTTYPLLCDNSLKIGFFTNNEQSEISEGKIKTQDIPTKNTDDFIPSLSNKNAQYSSAVNKSLSKEFAEQRQQRNTNPIYGYDGNEMFVKKTKSNSSSNAAVTAALSVSKDASIAPISLAKKLYSFEIDLGSSSGPSTSGSKQDYKNSKKFVQNLEKFEKDRRTAAAIAATNNILQFGGTLGMEYVPHKPPVASKRSSSMRSKNKMKDKFNTTGGQTYLDRTSNINFKLSNNDIDNKKSIDMFSAINTTSDNENMDSLECLNKSQKLHKENSVDSLDNILLPTQQHLFKQQSQMSSSQTTPQLATSTPNFSQSSEYYKFYDIEQKINIINKLVEMEEKKLEQEKKLKEIRMKPFLCDSTRRGYVKSLTLNFDKLNKNDYYNIDNNNINYNNKLHKIKRNYSLPDVLEGAKFQTFNENINPFFNQHKKQNNNNNDLCYYHNNNNNNNDCAKLRKTKASASNENFKLNNDEFNNDFIGDKESADDNNNNNGLNDDDDDDQDNDDDDNDILSIAGGNLAKNMLSAHDDASSIRRACSLSDLSMGKGYKGSPSTPHYNKTTTNNRGNSVNRQLPKKIGSTVGSKNSPSNTQINNNLSGIGSGGSTGGGLGMRSVSVGILNHASDSESELMNSRGGILRPTISSQNKTNGTTTPTNSGNNNSNRQYNSTKNVSGITTRRRGMQSAYSNINLSTTGQDDSSSEEATSTTTIQTTPSNKPVVPPRPRSISVDNHKRTLINSALISNNLHGNKRSSVSNINSSSTTVTGMLNRNNENITMGNDIDHSELSSQLCSKLINDLMLTTNSVIKLHQRLKHTDKHSDNNMIKELEDAVLMTQNMLKNITTEQQQHYNNNSTRSNEYSPSVTFQLNTADTQTGRATTSREQSGINGTGDYLQMMDKCSDLLNKVQKHK